jgi:hypothetical protein
MKPTEVRGVRASGPLLVVGVILLAGCDSGGPPLFELLSTRRTGVTFVNEAPEAPDINIINYLNYYNGGGVAAGDVDGDGLPDLFFTSNLGPDRLYRNVGDYRFEDVTEQAGVGGAEGWTTGATMADVNGDGHLDIYVSSVAHLALPGGNVLFINDGDGTFTDRTAEYGLEHVGYSTQATFFDYDGDGDLDMYLVNHSTHEMRGRVFDPQRRTRHPEAGDRLFRNDDDGFVDASEEAGIFGGVEGYGLAVSVSDLDSDGCPDLFISNDFHESDFLYYNNCDGSFTESIATSTGHTTRSSMGLDVADFNNDGRPDVVVLDMLPEREEILKSSFNAQDLSIYLLTLEFGYHPQFARNTLQVNRGGRRFSEIGYLAGVYATDWSWSPLLADLDNDGHKDLFVTNGIYRRPNDLDYLSYVADRAVQASMEFGITEELLAPLLERMPQVPIPSYAFRNNGDLTFTNIAREWGLAQPGFSNGAAYVDLNNDGWLDLVVNNFNSPAGIYRNRAAEFSENHFLTVNLHGSGANTTGIGAKIIIKHDGSTQLVEQVPTRGFQSSVDPRLHFGLGTSPRIDSLIVVWPDHRYQLVTDVVVDQTITLSQDEASGRYVYEKEPAEQQLFEDLTTRLAIDYRHQENPFFEYTGQPFIPHQVSLEGPALAVADVDSDGLDDMYVGGAKWQAGQLLIQRRDGTFRNTNASVFQADSLAEDVDAVFFDANGDGHQDLYVVSAGNEFWGEHEPLLDRLYVNDGRGNYERPEGHIPTFFENGSCAVPGDFDGDGHLDLFVGSRVVSRQYGLIPRSYLLQNDGTGQFRDVTIEKAPALAEAGMVTGAAWVDYDHDGQLDLIVVGEWMPIRVYQQQDGRFEDRTVEAGFSGTNGWWNSVTVADLRGDGRPDLILGNLGLNSYVQASPEEPARLYIHDFTRDGSLDQFLTFYKHGVSYPMAGRDDVLRAMPQMDSRYTSYADFGASQIQDIFPASELVQAQVREAYVFASSVALNNGDGSFDLRPLPTEAQFAPIYAALLGDFDGDGHSDVIVAGNFSGVTPVRGRYDASYGLLLRGDGAGGLASVDLEKGNLVIEGQVRDMKLLLRADGDRLIIVARNNDTVQILRPLR